ncbi:LysM peptidoglycan-binding domain-containing protein [Vannielia litorea]|uniref:LysM peptidoglycan-binding domain-containing protein n=1 Tax=Vannielia litorea TaxID=1217970 RepID=UPI001BD044F7|nr:LysM peptidoglycan-binding domain-containing protein [Vannielia litorea]
MSAWKSISPVVRGALAAALMVLAALGLWLWQAGAPVEAPAVAAVDAKGEDAAPAAARENVPPESAASTEEPSRDEQQTAATEARPESEAEERSADAGETAGETEIAEDGAELPLPTFDLVRIEPDGSALIAGSAAPGDTVTLLLDGAALAETTADGSGAFVALAEIRPGATPRVLTLSATGQGDTRHADASVIVAPAPATAAAAGTGTPGDAAEDSRPEVASAAPPEQVETPPETDGANPARLRTEAVSTAPGAPSVPDTDGAPVPETTATPQPATTASETAADEPAPEPVAVADNVTAQDDTPGEAKPQTTRVAVATQAEVPATDAVESDDAAPVGSANPEQDQTVAETADRSGALPPAETPATAAAEPATVARGEPTRAAAAADEPQLLVATGEGLRVLQPSASAAEVPLRVETIGYSEGAVTLSGQGRGGPSDLRIYLDNAPVAVAPLETDGTWTAELNNVSPGTYTLRVDQLAGDGKVTGRFETPFLRETEEALARAAPADSAPRELAVSVITVQPGYSLWAIATDRYGDGMAYHKVLQANRNQIRDPDLIYPGQVFDLPE